MKEKKKLLHKHEFFTKGKGHIIGKLLFWTLRRWEIRSCFDSKSWCKMIFSLAWNTTFSQYVKVFVLNFSDMRNTVFFWFKKLMQDDILFSMEYHFFEYGKVHVLNFSEIGNTVFLWSKKLIGSWYFLGILEIFMIFQDLENMLFRAVDIENSWFN